MLHMGDSTQPQQKSAGAGENCNFVIAVNFYPVKKSFSNSNPPLMCGAYDT